MDSSALNVIFRFLNIINIPIDKQKFLIQFVSHPVSNSLLAIKDSLEFFNIDTQVYRQDLLLLEDHDLPLLTLLNTEKGPLLHIIQKIDGDQFEIVSSKEKANVQLESLKSKWSGVILNVTNRKKSSNRLNLDYNLMGIGLIILCILYQPVSAGNYFNLAFLLTSGVGLLLSYFALQSIQTSSYPLSKLCDGTGKFDCSIIKSRKQVVPLLKNVGFGDLSFVYFSAQFIIFGSLVLFNNEAAFNQMQSKISLLTLPVILLSIYYQLIDKKWCLICLGIISVLLIQLTLKYQHILTYSDISIKFILYSALILTLVILAYSFHKTSTVEIYQLKNELIPALKVARNFNTFFNLLKSNKPFTFPAERIEVGNKEAPLTISCLTNPFCGGCEEVHSALNKLQNKYPDLIKVDIYFKTDLTLDTPETILFFKTLYSIYTKLGSQQFTIALHKWYELNDQNLWHKIFGEGSESEGFYEYFRSVNNWAGEMNFPYTPVVFINGFVYPQNYDIKLLQYFIEDLKYYAVKEPQAY